MRIATWNVNSLKARQEAVENWLSRRATVAGMALAAGLLVASCGSPAAVPSLSPKEAASSVTPATAAPASPSAAPAQTPTADPSRSLDPDQRAARAALDAFVELAGDPELSLRIDQVGSFHGAGSTADFAYAIDISGSDFAAVITLAGETTEVRALSGYGYIKQGDADWLTTEIDAATVLDITNPWQYLGDVDELRFVSRAPTQPEAFQFANGAAIDYQTGAMRRNDLVGKITELNFIVLPDGTPVELTFGAASPDGQNGTVTMTSRITFSKVGEPITIEKPPQSP